MSDFAITQVDMKGLNEDQMSAIFDALVTAAWADGNVSQAEMALFEQEVVKIPWGKDEADLVKMVHASKDRVAALKDKDSVLQFIKDVSDRLPAKELKEKVLYTMCLIMFTDRDLNNAEKNVITAFMEAFEISKDRFQAIGTDVRGIGN